MHKFKNGGAQRRVSDAKFVNECKQMRRKLRFVVKATCARAFDARKADARQFKPMLRGANLHGAHVRNNGDANVHATRDTWETFA